MAGCRPADHRMMMKAKSGFTLTELVIVIAVIAVLMALAIPSYQSFVMKSRRTEAKELLYTAAQRQQQYFTMNNVYTTNAGSLSVPTSSIRSEKCVLSRVAVVRGTPRASASSITTSGGVAAKLIDKNTLNTIM